MTHSTSDNPEPSDFEVPPALRKDLQQMWEPHEGVPPVIDEAIMDAARQQLSPPRRLRPWWGWAPVAAAAALVVLMVWTWRPVETRQASPTGTAPVAVTPVPRTSNTPNAPAALRGDLDGNGHIDILDAFALARQLRDPARAASADPDWDQNWDVNQDGTVDNADVDTLAAWAVRLEQS